MTHETLDSAKHSEQPLIFLKLDFSKAYDTVDWDFLFRIVTRLGFPDEFLTMVRLLFVGASGQVNVNGKLSPAFDIERGVRQGCPLAPYLFFIVAEVLNTIFKRNAKLGLIRGIQLPCDRQQILLQYADDTSLILRGEEEPVKTPYVNSQDCMQGLWPHA